LTYHIFREHPEKLIATYHGLLYQIDEWNLYQSDDNKFEGKIIGVDQFGRLVIEDRGAVLKEYDIKEIRFL
ncbi:MAG: hypothetical protein GQ527_04305, partial [Bacteroidales bacterium]|nr:hypothetical protein [Bacteroidales bacterium]